MITVLLKNLIPFTLRRMIRNTENRIRLKFRPLIYQIWLFKYDQRPKISEKLNADFVAVLSEQTHLAPDAFYQINQFLKQYPDTDFVYTDSDQVNAIGIRYHPYFKTDWDPYLFQSQNYLEPFYVIRKSVLAQNNGQLPTNLNKYKIRHLSKILCHSRQPFQISRLMPPLLFELPPTPPLVSIIIPTKDGLHLLKPCLESLLTKNHKQHFEILIVNNNSEHPATLEYFKKIQNKKIKVLDYPHPFNYSAINNFAAKKAEGEILLLLNNDIEMITKNGLDAMLALILQPDIGIVGAKLLFPNKTIQHAGIVLGIDGTARHVLTGLTANHPGYFANLQHIRCCSAVTAACLMIRKSLYETLGGLDEALFPVTFNDIDLCLKVRTLGYRIVFTPYAQFYHKESATRGEDLSTEKRARVKQEKEYFIAKWGKQLGDDPFYNPNLSLKSTDYSLAFPPRHTMTSVHP